MPKISRFWEVADKAYRSHTPTMSGFNWTAGDRVKGRWGNSGFQGGIFRKHDNNGPTNIICAFAGTRLI